MYDYFGMAVIIMAIFIFAESFFSSWNGKEPNKLRWVSNLILFFIQLIIPLLIAPLTGHLFSYFNVESWQGLLSMANVGFISSFILILFGLQLLNYWTHRAFHEIPILWRIHSIHHSDTEIDATTTHRHHPFEVLLTLIPTTIFLIIFKPDTNAIFLYQLITLIVVTSSHSCISFGDKAQSYLRMVLVSSDSHRLHHMADPKHANCNFSNVLPIFDHIFGTFRETPLKNQSSELIGLDFIRSNEKLRIDKLLILPLIFNSIKERVQK
jgi:sterol desaturase/sphingolipid hydroxylase (fatty acid hydroxylase superfamily)